MQIQESHRQLARTVADSMSLALANIKLRLSLREQSIRDALTGLFNRRYMEESLDREIHRAVRHNVSVGIVMLDIDHFKRFNDTYGHPAGDVLLRELGRMLRIHIREADIACRYGGEEFTLILPEATLAVTEHRAEHIREAIKRIRVEVDGRTLPPVTVSAGVAVYPDHGLTGEDLLRAGDEALYRAKREGRDRVVVR
jgi:diguanylate cyclase (GGDEF)-like protein